jgi:hypothetical protein
MTAKFSLIRNSATALLVAGAITAAAPAAQAFPHFGGGFHHFGGHWGHHWGPGLGIGLAAGALAYGAYAASVCHVERRFDAYGNYLGAVRVCD